jgi:CYTH domain-containing protein
MEIERKWLISPEKIPYRLEELPALAIEQAYISFNPVVRVRKINEGERYILTIKRPTEHGGIAAAEAEHEIDRGTYEFLLGHAAGTVITKTRYLHTLPAGLTEEIDVFSGALKGLAYLEIEFPDLETAKSWPTPAWAEADVTMEGRFKNSALALHGMPEI